MQNLQADFLLFYFKTFWFRVWRCLRPRLQDAEAADAKLRSISADKKRKKFLSTKKSLLANFQHDCLTTGLRTVRQSLKFMIFVISSTVVKELNAKFASRIFIILFQHILVSVLNPREPRTLNCGQFLWTRKKKSF